jgi:inorganic pyrophosphatase
MKVAVFANVRTTINAEKEGFKDAFNTAFRAGSVLGFALPGLGIIILYLALLSYSGFFNPSDWSLMTGAIAGYGLGGKES